MPDKFINRLDFEVKNIANLRFLRMSLQSGQVTEISGGNGKGKTTLMNLVKSTLSGGKCKLPEWLVTDFEEKGEFSSSIDGEVTVQRRVNSGETATALTVLNERGEPLKRPAEVLRNLFGDGTYLDPVDVVNMSPIERTKAIATALNIDPAKANALIQEVTGVDYKIKCREQIFPAIQQAHDSAYNLRRQVGNEAEAADAQAIGVLEFVPPDWWELKGEVPAPIPPTPLGDIYDKKSKAETRNAERQRLSETIGEQQQYLIKFTEQLSIDKMRLDASQSEALLLGQPEDTAPIEAEIARLTGELQEMRARNLKRTSISAQVGSMSSTVAMATVRLAEYQTKLDANLAQEKQLGGFEDVSALQTKIDAHEADMANYKEALRVHGERSLRYRQAAELRDKAEQLRIHHEELEKRVKRIDHLPVELLQGVPVPIPGMVISGDKIFLPDGDVLREFGAFGDADQFRFAAMMAMKLAPVNVICIDSIEKCDEDRRQQLYQLIADEGFIGLTTRVTKGPLQTAVATGPSWGEHAQSAA
jgi:ABC-type Na+ transport system ATPase subunit NatA